MDEQVRARETKGLPNAVDRYVGLQLRLRRQQLGMSQEQLAEHLGITFQQVQKYERGLNRVSAGRLHAISMALGVPPSVFFPSDRLQSAPVTDDLIEMLIHDQDLQQLHRAYLNIKDPLLRKRILALVSALDPERVQKAGSVA